MPPLRSVPTKLPTDQGVFGQRHACAKILIRSSRKASPDPLMGGSIAKLATTWAGGSGPHREAPQISS